tara:strand:+ start:9136 stop:10107 length:972 start_codon:yes stop_codon:yes gene_type:complete
MSTIAVDAMGGDSAPEEVVKGAILAKNQGVDVILSGDENLISTYLGSEQIPIVNYPQVISMDDDPAKAIRTNKNSSILGALNLLKEKKADAVFSAGSTGASLIGAISVLGKIKGVTRPTIATVLPGQDREVILVDSGANLEVKPKILYQFAVMGSKLSELLFEIDNPRIGLVNNGEESSKGRELEKSTYKLLNSSELNFIGNVEGKDFANSKVDVFVTDGFTGNVVLKTMEGVARLQMNMISDSLKENLLKPLLTPVKNAMSPVRDALNPNSTNGSYLLGVNGLVIIGHGSSNAEAIKNALLFTKRAIDKKFINKFSKVSNEL